MESLCGQSSQRSQKITNALLNLTRDKILLMRKFAFPVRPHLFGRGIKKKYFVHAFIEEGQ